jgi:predicted kinase
MNRLVLMMGLPRSGKTRRARGRGYPIVSPDSIRLAMHGQRFATLAEPLVWAIAKIMVRALFLAGHDAVTVDATNCTRKRRDEWRSRDWVRIFEVVPTDAATCRARAEAENDTEILPVIDRMAAEWEPLTAEEYTAEERELLDDTPPGTPRGSR